MCETGPRAAVSPSPSPAMRGRPGEGEEAERSSDSGVRAHRERRRPPSPRSSPRDRDPAAAGPRSLGEEERPTTREHRAGSRSRGIRPLQTTTSTAETARGCRPWRGRRDSLSQSRKAGRPGEGWGEGASTTNTTCRTSVLSQGPRSGRGGTAHHEVKAGRVLRRTRHASYAAPPDGNADGTTNAYNRPNRRRPGAALGEALAGPGPTAQLRLETTIKEAVRMAQEAQRRSRPADVTELWVKMEHL